MLTKKKKRWDDIPGCSLEAALNVIGGKWKGVFLFHLLDGTMRFNELSRLARGASPRLIVKQLRELEEDGLVHRKVYAVVPPKVEYSLTEEGRSLHNILHALSEWGKIWVDNHPVERVIKP
ncbi:winged helix-turn-helix transcriptional regulator [Gluconobacter cerinus]|uniref:winged helix-turn-helix transcriptional regulator n=1 Tax=Gluconobacter cerinus TaxID=38307 RepID=UPI001B8AA498|nr:helix-turn-helix domain-containing protein [Gluconobacter cerinus]MBS1023546.1 helix-turn-helix transcriptional regulator [Gluconobacter cerinus]MBS1045450.1 helix-turn-helix transcriptional regulator [Gluconobacter cerinus]